MESTGLPGKIQISSEARNYLLVHYPLYECQERGKVEVKVYLKILSAVESSFQFLFESDKLFLMHFYIFPYQQNHSDTRCGAKSLGALDAGRCSHTPSTKSSRSPLTSVTSIYRTPFRARLWKAWATKDPFSHDFPPQLFNLFYYYQLVRLPVVVPLT